MGTKNTAETIDNIEESDFIEETIRKYKILEEKCDAAIKKIRRRKNGLNGKQ